MGEAGQPRKGEGGGAAGVAKRRRRRRPRRASGQKAEGAAKTATPTATKTGSSRGGVPASVRSTRKRGSRKSSSKKKSTKTRRKAPAVPTKREISAGGVVYRRNDDEVEVVLASRRTRRGQLAWGLAKGGIEDEESMEDAAVREVREETGLLAEIEASLGETRYFYVWENVRIRKTVHFFLMRHTGGDIDDRDDEMEEVRWFPLERALQRAAYRGERDVLVRAAELLR
ncbi:MAG: NUDIX hydrolase [Actinomycetota bacterium]|nr:NUDIX hydrolase [Actinomycetota bacterium]